MTEYSFKPFWYTILVFLLMCALSYAVNAQAPAQKLSVKDAVSLDVQHNRDVKAASLYIDKAQEHVRIAKSLLLPTVSTNAQAGNYFLSPFSLVLAAMIGANYQAAIFNTGSITQVSN